MQHTTSHTFNLHTVVDSVWSFCFKDRMFFSAIITVTPMVVGGWIRAFQGLYWLVISTVVQSCVCVFLHTLHIRGYVWVCVSCFKSVWTWIVMQITLSALSENCPSGQEPTVSARCAHTHTQNTKQWFFVTSNAQNFRRFSIWNFFSKLSG